MLNSFNIKKPKKQTFNNSKTFSINLFELKYLHLGREQENDEKSINTRF